jgi:hypothetical protein
MARCEGCAAVLVDGGGGGGGGVPQAPYRCMVVHVKASTSSPCTTQRGLSTVGAEQQPSWKVVLESAS